ncbi:hypothetical protein [Hyalangium minutum]|uniref:Cytochrome c family protein n=1 Tax=Hyalangium minutum TaxID=394096 RepID=A0A085W8N4_9BACT|nr:hypothetical protein [Hyalangium minutum]KFE64047.1 hypothetical protein DB31_2460 [Hyalangium minutum]
MPLLSSCNLIDVTGDENSNSGRGAKVFDPYQAAASGAIKLSLQMLNGCAFTPNAGFVAKNSLNIPYPDLCPNMDRAALFADSTGPLDPAYVPAKGKLELLANTTYFLNQFSITDVITDRHKNPSDLSEFVKWLKTETHFAKLDWRNLGQVSNEWEYAEAFPGLFDDDAWNREVLFDNANWQRVTDDTFKIEVLDSGGVVRSEQTYSRSEFLVESPYPGHSRVAWKMENVAPPLSPQDVTPRPVQGLPGNLPLTPTFRSFMRMEMVGSTNPFKTLSIGNLQGDGAIRVTWSQLPEDPFYFPVSFVQQTDVQATCTDDQGTPKQCGFGLAPGLSMVAPPNGTFYKPGETVNMFVEYRDEEGNRLHGPDLLPSSEETFTGKANGLLSVNPGLVQATREADAGPVVLVAGPLQDMRVHSDVIGERPFFPQESPKALISELASFHLYPTLYQSHTPTRVSVKLPVDAKPGTYVAYVKGSRYFLGERVSRLKAFFFQVGQDQLTSYPGRVGNCQICHRGVLSLDNLRHGLSVDHIEGCKACHGFANDIIYRPQETIHKIHMRSKKYPANKNECNICHLTKESATRPSIVLCKSCHPSTHDNEYFATQFNARTEPNRHSNCAQACHGAQTPKSHILPEN